jgi:sphingolipid delta-4 desaturase
MGNVVSLKSTKDYVWSYTDEPHATRRREILAKYPEVRGLFGYDPSSKYIALWWMATQWFLASFVAPNLTWSLIVLLAYAYGGIAGHALFLAMHEITHNLFFQSPLHNKIFGMQRERRKKERREKKKKEREN